MAKYLTKEQVVADFKRNYMPQIDQSLYEKAWELLLDSLHKDKKISDNQRNVWKFPKDLLD